MNRGNKPVNLLQVVQASATSFQNSNLDLAFGRGENDKICIVNYHVGTYGQGLLQYTLKKNKKYRIVLGLILNDTKRGPWFSFGLGTQQQGDYYHEKIAFFELQKGGGIDTVVRGNDLQDPEYWKKSQTKRYEMRFDLKNKIVKISDFPSYSSVMELANKKNIKDECEYAFYFHILGTFNILEIIEFEELDEFDNKM